MSPKTGRPSYLRPGPDTQRRRHRRTVLVVAVVAALAAGLAGAGLGYLAGRPGGTDAAVAELRAADAARDATQIVELTAQARRTRDEVGPLLLGLEAAATGTPAAPTQVAAWQQTMRSATAAYADPPSGSTATNVARGGLRAAVEAIAVAVETYASAVRLPSADRAPLLAVVERQCTLAATTWSIAATQLDQINIDAGNGHQHVYLETKSGGGAFTPDGATEGHSD